MQEVFEKIIEKLKKELKLADEEKLRCARENPLQFDSAKGYAHGVGKAIEIVKQEAEEHVTDINVGNNGWIPFVQREMTEDEKESFGDLNFMLDCQLPDENEEILITYKFKDELYVDVDTFMRDGSECYLDSGRDFVTEAVAWRKKPQPYQPKGE